MEKIEIEVEKSEKPAKQIRFEDVPAGCVFEYLGGIQALKIKGGDALLLNFGGSPCAWLDKTHEFNYCPVTRILGRLKKIIYVPED